MPKFLSSLVLLAVACLFAAPVQAQPIRTFVALTGNDANPCTFASPCKSAQHAHDVVAAGGEVRMLDPGSYGLLTITKAISILGDGHGGIAAQSGNTAITINAGPNDKINLRGLVIEGFGTGSIAIRFNSGLLLNVQDSIIRNFSFVGLSFVPAAASELYVSRTLISDTSGAGAAVQVAPLVSGAASVTLDHVRLEHGDNLGANADAGGGPVQLMIADSVVTGFLGAAISGHSNSGQAQVMVRNNTIYNNGTGVISISAATVVRVTKSTITGNAVGFAASTGQIVSFGDNSIAGNAAGNGPPTSTIALQ